MKILTNKWITPQVDFNYLNCWCGAEIETDDPEIMKIVKQDLKLKKKAIKVAVENAKSENISTEGLENEPYNGDFKIFAKDKIAVYQ